MRTQTTPAGTTYHLKTTAEVKGTSAQNAILDAAGEAYEGTDQALVVTSGNEGEEGDGVHSEGSLHYESNGSKAIDLRVWNLGDPGAVADQIADTLGSNFDVVFGADVGHSTHIHVERDPA
jgi:hypothetical protein